MITRQQQGGVLVAAAAAAIIAALVLSGHSGVKVAVSAQAEADTGLPDVWGCPAHEIAGAPLRARHGLFRRADGPKMRTCLSEGGWAWYLDPPADQGL